MLNTIKKAEKCESLLDIRNGIDHIDQEVIRLLGVRMEYVLNAAKFKPNVEAIPAPERVLEMLADRRKWSQEVKLDEEFIVPLYERIIQWFILQQVDFWKKNRV